MNNYKVTIYIPGKEHEMIMNAKSKSEAISIVLKLFNKEVECKKLIIVIRDLTFEEKQIYGIDRDLYEETER